MQVVSDKIEVEARGIQSTFSPLINSIFYTGENQMTAKSVSKICSVDGCKGDFLARGMCSYHYNQYRRKSGTFVREHYFGIGKTREERFWSKIIITVNTDECWEWQGAKNPDGYGQTSYRNISTNTHRLAWFFTHAQWPVNILRHSCDNPPCCNPGHLIDGTHAENSHDRDSRGRSAIGEKAGRSILTENDVLQIRERHLGAGRHNRGKNSALGLSREFGVGRSTIQAIISRKSWRHLPSR